MIIGLFTTGQAVLLLYGALCAYFFFDGRKNPTKYKPFKLFVEDDLFPLGAVVDQDNADFYVAEACIDATLLTDCYDLAKSLKVKMSKKEVESLIRDNDIQTPEEFVSKIFEKE
ncbi:MAG: hypothetical protein KYX63_12795 [Alteromonas macleodii]|nr:hypothetical protein [Alteromonas macleodii]